MNFLSRRIRIMALLLVGLMILTLMVVAGCTPKTEEQPPNPDPQQNTQDAEDADNQKEGGETAQDNAVGTSERMEDMAENAVDAATDVEGVEAANVVVLGNTALIGVGLDKDIAEEKIDDIKSEIDQAVKERDQRIKNTSITADPDLTTRIKKVTTGISEGRPISESWDELTDIFKRMTPAVNQS